MQKSQWIECSGHTRIFRSPHYISFGPVQKTALWRWNFHTESVRNYTLLSRYLQLKVHIVNPDSNLVALNRAYEYWQLIWAFNDDVMIQENESRSERFSCCWDFRDSRLRRPWKAIQWRFKIAVVNWRGETFSAFACDYRCWIGLENRNGAQMRSMVA